MSGIPEIGDPKAKCPSSTSVRTLEPRSTGGWPTQRQSGRGRLPSQVRRAEGARRAAPPAQAPHHQRDPRRQQRGLDFRRAPGQCVQAEQPAVDLGERHQRHRPGDEGEPARAPGVPMRRGPRKLAEALGEGQRAQHGERSGGQRPVGGAVVVGAGSVRGAIVMEAGRQRPEVIGAERQQAYPAGPARR